MPRATRTRRQQTDGSTITVTVPSNGTPPADSEQKSPIDFWEACANVPPSGWGTDYMIYVYRDDPPGRLSGYIAKLTESIEREDFAQRFGGYKYRLMLNKNGKMVAATTHNVALPPKAIGSMDPAMLGSAGSFLQGGGTGMDQTALIQFADIIRQQVEKQNPADKNTIELLMNASKSAMDIMKTQTPNPMDTVRLVMEMMRQNAKPEDETTKLLMGKIIEKAFTPAENSVATQIESVLKIAEALGMRPGGGSRGPDLGTMFVSKIPDLISGAVTLMTKYQAIVENNRRIAEMQRLPANHNLAPGSIPVQPQPAPQPAAAAPPATFTPLEREPIGAAAAEIATAPGMPQDDDPVFFERMKQKVVQNIMMGVPAESIIDYISIESPVLITVLREANEEQLKKFFTDDAVLRQAANFAGFDQVIRNAVSYMRDNVSESSGPN